MPQHWTLDIAGCACPLTEPEAVLRDLRGVFAEFQRRADAYRRQPRNPHLCRAGCGHCCEKGAFFAVSLAEALMLALGVEALPETARRRVRLAAQSLLRLQRQIFAQVEGPPDVPGGRDEAWFSSGGRRWGRFTSIEAVLASIRRTAAMPTGHVPS